MRDFKRQGFHLFHSDEFLMQVLRIEMYISDISTLQLKLLSCVVEFFMFVFQCCVFSFRLQEDPPAGVSGAPSENNIMIWNAVIFG